LGLQFDFVSSEQVEHDALTTGKFKVLILPLSVAISPMEAKSIEAFVTAGGVVIADAAAGIMDDHCAWRQDAAITEFFGITAAPADKRSFKIASGAAAVTEEGARWGMTAAD